MNIKLGIETIIKIVLSILFFGCLLDWEYGYFQFVRFLGMIGFAILAYKSKQRENKTLTVVWAASAILINPIIKIALGRELWNIVDVIWAILLIGSIFYEKRTE